MTPGHEASWYTDNSNAPQMAKARTPRTAHRPNDGDAQPCPFCRALMFFQEARSNDTLPGWFCSCGYRILVRQPAKPSFKEAHRELAERRVKAFRKSMQVRAHAERLLKKSQRLADRRRQK